MEMYIAIAAALLLLLGFGIYVFRSKRGKIAPAEAPVLNEVIVTAPEAKKPKELSTRLEKTRGTLGTKLSKIFGTGRNQLDSAQWEAVEEALLEGDVGIQLTTRLIEGVKNKFAKNETRSLNELIQVESLELLSGLEHGPKSFEGKPKPYVISIVGINGVGKTTTIGKLAQRFRAEGKSVLLSAADTFRAGAIAQLKVWADRVGADFVTGREGADPGAVTFDSISAAVARGTDIVLVDTAGRLHTKSNLMEELKKIHRVMKKVIPEAPHETWLVVDGTLGQNSLNQAREFKNALDLTGLVVTKLDGTAKGGAVIAIASDLQIPIRFIGVGESVEDLIPFEPKPFVEAILG